MLVLIGLPGSGKSTYANELVANTDYVKVSRDDIRLSLKGSYIVPSELEDLVSSIQDTTIKTLISKNKDFVVDNTHCKISYIKDLINKYGKDTEITLHVVGSELSLKQVHERNVNRDKAVPTEVVDKMNAGFKYVKSNLKELNDLVANLANSVPTKHVIPKRNDSLPSAIIVDIDGTIANMNDTRGPFDWHKVDLDTPVIDVIRVVRELSKTHSVIFLSGREDSCRQLTEDWLLKHYGSDFAILHMRKEGDFRKDAIIKKEIYINKILPFFNVRASFDDRDQVVHMWREELGLTCFQVAYGNF